MATARKTAKYYRDIISKGNVSEVVNLLPEIIKRFGYKRWEDYSKTNDVINLRNYTKFEWNHQIESFFLSDKGNVCVDIYWQGDSTDGNKSEYAKDVMYGKTIPAEHEFIGGRTYYTHSDIRISREEFANAIKALAEYLSPENIKKRKIAQAKAELNKKIFNMIDAKKKDLCRGDFEGFWNGRMAVQKVLELHPELYKKTFEELKPIIEKVYDNNDKSDFSLRGGWYNGEKKYNLAI